MTTNELLDKIIWLLTVFLFSSFIIFSSNIYSRFFLLGITCVIAFVILLRYRLKIKFHVEPFHLFVGLFTMFCFLSSCWAIDRNAAIIKCSTLVQILICMSVLYIHYQQKESVTELLDCVRCTGYILTLFVIVFYGWDTIKYSLSTGIRLESVFANINAVGMLASISIILTLDKIFSSKFSFSFLFALPEILIIAASGSRKALAIVIVGYFLIYIFRHASKRLFITLFKITIFILIGLILFKFLLSLDIFNGINHRMEGLISIITGEGRIDTSSRARMEMIEIGLIQFKQTPWLGIGVGNSYLLTIEYFGRDWTYLHNNYIDLLANVGIIGTFLYYLIILYPLYHLFVFFKNSDKNIAPCLTLIILMITIIDWGSVSYYSKTNYFYIMIFYLQTKLLLKKI